MKKKSIKESIYLISIIFTSCVLALSFFAVFMAFTFDSFMPVYYESLESKISNDELVKVVVETCNSHKSNMGKMKCVVEFYESHYDYTPHNLSVRPGKEFVDKGGVCRDFALNTCATINQLKGNLSCSYHFNELHNHVFFVIDHPNGYCTFGGGLWSCIDLKDLEI